MSRKRALAMVGAVIELMHDGTGRGGAESLPELRGELAVVVAALISGPGSVPPR